MKTLRRFFLRPAGDAAVFVLAAIALTLCGQLFEWDPDFFRNAILSLAVGIAFFSLRAARRTERQKATLDFLNAYNDSNLVAEGAKILNQWEKGDEHLSLDEQQKFAVREFLNFFELLAIGLKNGIYDEKMVMDAMETAIVRYYKRGKGFIEQSRVKNHDAKGVIYEHFEDMSEQIQKRMRKPK